MKKIYILLFVLSIGNSLFSQWYRRASMFDYGRYSGVSMVINGKGYVGLGQNYLGQQVYDFWQYDPETDKWKQMNDFPGTGSYAATSFVINGKGYVCLGADSFINCSNEIWEYNPYTDSWTRKADFPGIPRYGALCFVIGNNAYVGTGSFNIPDNYLSDMWKYSVNDNTWTQIADFPGGMRNHGTGFSAGGFGYAGTGLNGYLNVSNDFWRYNPTANSWDRIPDMPGPARMGVVNFTIGDTVFVGMGYDLTLHHNTFWRFNAASRTWMNELIPPDGLIASHCPVSFQIDNKVFLTTGFSDDGMVTDLWEYSPINTSPVSELSVEIKMYPIPANDHITIDFGEISGEKQIQICSTKGQRIRTQWCTGNKVTLDISDLKPALYYFTIFQGKDPAYK